MNKAEVLGIIKEVKQADELIEEITKRKINEFLVVRESLFTRLDNLLADYFPTEIVELLKEYQDDMHRSIRVGILWIDYSRPDRGVRVRLDPTDYVVGHAIGRKDSYVPISLNGLKSCVNEYNEYLMLEKMLKEQISEIYRQLCDWKMSECASQLEELDKLTFSMPSKPERYRVHIVIERDMMV